MTSITTRAGKGTPLTHTEVDDNFTNLNADKLEASNNLSDVSSASAARTNLGLGTAATTASTDYATAAQGVLADSAVQPDDDASLGEVTVDRLTVDGKIAAGDELGNANLSNTLDYTSSAGVAGYRPINLIDSSAGIKISRPNDDGNGAFIEFQEWDSTITTLISRAMLTGEGGDLLYRNLTTGGGDHIFQGEANAELMRIDSSGNVGIGTSSPSSPLHVVGQITGSTDLVLTSGSASEIRLEDSTATNGYILRANVSSVADFGFKIEKRDGTDLYDVGLAASPHVWYGNAGDERMRIDSSGRVGIGTSSPEGLLTVDGQTIIGTNVSGSSNLTNLTSGTPPQLIAGWSVPAISWSPSSATEAVFTRDGHMQVDILAGANQFANLNFSDPDDEDVGQIAYDHSVDAMRFSTNGSEAMRIDSSGRVGIGTSSPAGNLDVVDESGAVAINFRGATDTIVRARQTGNTGFGYFSFGRSEDIFVGGMAYDHGGDNMRLYANNAERMRIDASGVVEIAEGSVVLNGSTISAIQVTVADNAVAELTFTNRRSGMLNVVEGLDDAAFPAFQEVFLGYADFGTSPYVITAIAGTETVINSSNALTGTTGTDGKFTIGLAGTSGTLYLENRRGLTRTYNVTLL